MHKQGDSTNVVNKWKPINRGTGLGTPIRSPKQGSFIGDSGKGADQQTSSTRKKVVTKSSKLSQSSNSNSQANNQMNSSLNKSPLKPLKIGNQILESGVSSGSNSKAKQTVSSKKYQGSQRDQRTYSPLKQKEGTSTDKGQQYFNYGSGIRSYLNVSGNKSRQQINQSISESTQLDNQLEQENTDLLKTERVCIIENLNESSNYGADSELPTNLDLIVSGGQLHGLKSQFSTSENDHQQDNYIEVMMSPSEEKKRLQSQDFNTNPGSSQKKRNLQSWRENQLQSPRYTSQNSKQKYQITITQVRDEDYNQEDRSPSSQANHKGSLETGASTTSQINTSVYSNTKQRRTRTLRKALREKSQENASQPPTEQLFRNQTEGLVIDGGDVGRDTDSQEIEQQMAKMPSESQDCLTRLSEEGCQLRIRADSERDIENSGLRESEMQGLMTIRVDQTTDIFDAALFNTNTPQMAATKTQETDELNETFGQGQTMDDFAKSLIYVGMSSGNGIPGFANVASSAVFGQGTIQLNNEDESLVMYQSAAAHHIEDESKAGNVQESSFKVDQREKRLIPTSVKRSTSPIPPMKLEAKVKPLVQSKPQHNQFSKIQANPPLVSAKQSFVLQPQQPVGYDSNTGSNSDESGVSHPLSTHLNTSNFQNETQIANDSLNLVDHLKKKVFFQDQDKDPYPQLQQTKVTQDLVQSHQSQLPIPVGSLHQYQVKSFETHHLSSKNEEVDQPVQEEASQNQTITLNQGSGLMPTAKQQPPGGLQATGGAGNLNDDINDLELAQLYGQISMFDQLTDYNENDNEEQNQYSPDKQRDEGCRGEDSSDHGEGDDDNDLHEYRKRMEVLNEDIQSFMDGGEENDEDNDMVSSNKVHNLQLKTAQSPEPMNQEEDMMPTENSQQANNYSQQMIYNSPDKQLSQKEATSSSVSPSHQQFSPQHYPTPYEHYLSQLQISQDPSLAQEDYQLEQTDNFEVRDGDSIYGNEEGQGEDEDQEDCEREQSSDSLQTQDQYLHEHNSRLNPMLDSQYNSTQQNRQDQHHQQEQTSPPANVIPEEMGSQMSANQFLMFNLPMNQQMQESELQDMAMQRVKEQAKKLALQVGSLEAQIMSQSLVIEYREREVNQLMDEKDALRNELDIKIESEQIMVKEMEKCREEVLKQEKIVETLQLRENELQTQNAMVLQENALLKQHLSQLLQASSLGNPSLQSFDSNASSYHQTKPLSSPKKPKSPPQIIFKKKTNSNKASPQTNQSVNSSAYQSSSLYDNLPGRQSARMTGPTTAPYNGSSQIMSNKKTTQARKLMGETSSVNSSGSIAQMQQKTYQYQNQPIVSTSYHQQSYENNNVNSCMSSGSNSASKSGTTATVPLKSTLSKTETKKTGIVGTPLRSMSPKFTGGIPSIPIKEQTALFSSSKADHQAYTNSILGASSIQNNSISSQPEQYSYQFKQGTQAQLSGEGVVQENQTIIQTSQTTTTTTMIASVLTPRQKAPSVLKGSQTHGRNSSRLGNNTKDMSTVSSGGGGLGGFTMNSFHQNHSTYDLGQGLGGNAAVGSLGSQQELGNLNFMMGAASGSTGGNGSNSSGAMFVLSRVPPLKSLDSSGYTFGDSRNYGCNNNIMDILEQRQHRK